MQASSRSFDSAVCLGSQERTTQKVAAEGVGPQITASQHRVTIVLVRAASSFFGSASTPEAYEGHGFAKDAVHSSIVVPQS